MSVARVRQDALALKPSERLRLVQDIWDSLTEEDPTTISVPDAHRQLIDERLAEHEKSPGETLTLSQFKRRVRAHLARKRKR